MCMLFTVVRDARLWWICERVKFGGVCYLCVRGGDCWGTAWRGAKEERDGLSVNSPHFGQLLQKASCPMLAGGLIDAITSRPGQVVKKGIVGWHTSICPRVCASEWVPVERRTQIFDCFDQQYTLCAMGGGEYGWRRKEAASCDRRIRVRQWYANTMASPNG